MSTPTKAVATVGRHLEDELRLAPPRRPIVTVDARLLRASGIGTYLQNLLPLITAARPDWQFNLMGHPEELGSFSWARAGHVDIIPCGAPIYGLREQFQLATRIPRNTNLVWSPHYNIPLGFRGRLLVTVHDVCHLALPQLTRGIHRRAYARFMFAALERRAGRIICVSEFTRSEFRRLVGDPARAVTIHSGVGREWFEIEAQDRPHPRPFVLFVGNVKPHKNVGTLIEAFKRIAHLVDHDLVIVGRQSGLITADLGVTQAAATLEGRIRLAGEVEPELLQQYFVHADALVLPSLYEGFGLLPLEAMACGCPTIVARAGSLPEICGDASLYFNPTDPDELASILLDVLSHEGVREELQELGHSHAALFSWDRCSEATLAVMEELLST